MKKIIFTLTMAMLLTELTAKLIKTKPSNLKVTHQVPLNEVLAESLFSGLHESPRVKKTLSILLKEQTDSAAPSRIQSWIDDLEKKVDSLRLQMDNHLSKMGVGLTRRHELLGKNDFNASPVSLQSLMND